MAVGDVIHKRYRVLRELGRGGMGTVYLADDLLRGEQVALKVIRPDVVQDDGLITRFRREARNLSLLRHPNIVGFLDAFDDEGSTVLVMEYVVGSNALDVVRASDTPLAAAVDIAAQVCAALEVAHAQDIMHRDLKPDNVMVTEGGVAKVMDFGLARRVTDATKLTQTGMALGTPSYMAPEQITGMRVDARADLYALGVLLYELCAGRLPFEGADPMTVLFKHLGETPASPRTVNPAIPPSLEDCLMQLLQKNPDDRVQSAGELRARLDGLRGDLRGAAPVPDQHVEGPPSDSTARRAAMYRLVGREREMTVLRGALDEAVQGKGRTVVLHGPTGIGKTRVALELRTLASSRGVRLFKGVGQAHQRPLSPLGQVLAQIGTIYPRIHQDRVDRPGSPLGAITGASKLTMAAAPAVSAAERWPIWEALTDVLRAVTEVAPVVLLLDHAQLADSATVEAVEHLHATMCLGDARFLLLLAFDTDEPEAERLRASLVRRLRRNGEAAEVALEPLAPGPLSELALMALGEPLAPASLEALHERSRGNLYPPNMVQLVGSGEETGKLDELMLRTSQSLEGEVEHAIEMALVLMEPVLMGLLAVIVGFIVISVFLPLYSFLQGMG